MPLFFHLCLKILDGQTDRGKSKWHLINEGIKKVNLVRNELLFTSIDEEIRKESNIFHPYCKKCSKDQFNI